MVVILLYKMLSKVKFYLLTDSNINHETKSESFKAFKGKEKWHKNKKDEKCQGSALCSFKTTNEGKDD